MNFMVEILSIFAAILLLCMLRAYKNPKPISHDVLMLLAGIFFPVLANIVLMLTPNDFYCRAAYIVYFCGTDMMFFYMMSFSLSYCDYDKYRKPVKIVLGAVFVLDCLSIILNPVFGHVYDIERILLPDNNLYCKLISLWYHKIHLGLSYVLIAAIILIYLIKIFNTSKIFRKKYHVIFIGFLLTAIWETYYIILNRPVDVSMFGYVVCGIFVYYYALKYGQEVLLEKMNSMIIDSVPDGLLFFDKDSTCVYANNSAERLLKISNHDYSSVKDRLIEITGDDDDESSNNKRTRCTINNDDGERICEMEFHKIFDGQGSMVGTFVRIDDLTEEIERINKENFAASHDLLTGIYNADNFYDKVRKRLEADPDTDYYLVCSDIKEFKLVNDRFGREAGDNLLIAIARKLEELDEHDTIYGRIGSDKFGVLIRKKDYAEERFLHAISNLPVFQVGSKTPITIHFGVYEIVDKHMSVAVMVDRCNMAIAGIKNDLDKRIAYYDEKLRDILIWEQSITGLLDEAIASGQIVPYLQAQVSTEGKVIGAEALVRWIHPTEGLLPPYKFIPLLEKNGMIIKIDRFMWESACKILKKWEEEGRDDLYLSVNISPKDFYLADVPEEMLALVKKYEIDPSRLRLEITESIMMDDSQGKIEILEKLRSYGFIVEMDDFGSGYSSLNMLKDMPVDILKLDMIFLNDSTHSEKTRMIMKVVIELAKNLGVPVIAEGVETQDQVQFLTDMGCDFFQGYYFARPVALEEYEKANLET